MIENILAFQVPGDMWEVGLWEDSLAVLGDELFYSYQVCNQAIVVPETIDAIRALTGIEREGSVSIEKTDRSLGIKHELIEPNRPLALEK